MTRVTASREARSLHSTNAWAPSPEGPKIAVGTPAAASGGRVHPSEAAIDHRLLPQLALHGAAEHPDDLSVLADLKRLPHHSHRECGVELVVLGAQPVEDGLQLRLDLRGCLAGDGAALDLEAALLGVGGELLAAGNQRRVDRRRADVPVRRPGEQ